MNDEDSASEQAEGGSGEHEDNDEVGTLFDQPEGVDWFLANQIWFADAFNVEQGVTLNVGGLLVSGILISGRTYFKELASLLRSSTQGTQSEQFGEMLGNHNEIFNQIYPERKEDEPYPNRPTSYVHLRNARIIGSNGSMIGNNVVLWRGKLASVDGFSFGNITGP